MTFMFCDLFQAGERALSVHCGASINAKFIGNAPCGYHSYKLPKTEENYGVKVKGFLNH